MPHPLRRLFCHYCRGKHLSVDCPDKSRTKPTRLFGTVIDGVYFPPPGVNVRIISIPSHVDGEALTALLRRTR